MRETHSIPLSNFSSAVEPFDGDCLSHEDAVGKGKEVFLFDFPENFDVKSLDGLLLLLYCYYY